MIQYGNVVNPISTDNIKRVDANSSGGMGILYNNGDLWVRGVNNFGCLGTGNNSIVNSWTLVRSGVDDFCLGVTGMLVKSTDGKLLYNGRDSILNNNTTFLQFADYTAQFTPSGYSVQNIKQMQVGQYSVLILMNNGALLAFGRNNSGEFGDGSSSSTTGLAIRQVAANVDKIQFYNLNSGYLSDGKFYRAGYNANYALGNGTTSDIRTFQVYNPPNGESAIIDFNITNYGTRLLTLSSTSGYNMYQCGINTSYHLGVNSTTATFVIPTFSTMQSILPSSNIESYALNIKGQVSLGDLILPKQNPNSYFWVTGDNRNGAFGTGDKTNISALSMIGGKGLPNNIDYSSEYVHVVSCSFNSNFVFMNNTIYGCGVNSGFGLNSTTFVSLGSYPT